MSIEKLLEDPKYKEYKLLKNYVLLREDCYNKDGELEPIKIYPEIIEKYVKAYEFVSGENIEGKYPNYQKMIDSRQEKITFYTKRADRINVRLFFHAKLIELLLTADPNETREDRSSFSLLTFLGEYDVPENRCISYVAITKAGIKIASEGLILRKMVTDNFKEEHYGFRTNASSPDRRDIN